MSDYGFVPACSQCDWFAINKAGEPLVTRQLAAFNLASAHYDAAHGKGHRAAREADAAILAATHRISA